MAGLNLTAATTRQSMVPRPPRHVPRRLPPALQPHHSARAAAAQVGWAPRWQLPHSASRSHDMAGTCKRECMAAAAVYGIATGVGQRHELAAGAAALSCAPARDQPPLHCTVVKGRPLPAPQPATPAATIGLSSESLSSVKSAVPLLSKLPLLTREQLMERAAQLGLAPPAPFGAPSAGQGLSRGQACDAARFGTRPSPHAGVQPLKTTRYRPPLYYS